MAESNASLGMEQEIRAVIFRCGCGDPLTIHERDENGALLPCPTPRSIEDIGVIYYWHRNPLIRFFKRRYYKFLRQRKEKRFKWQTSSQTVEKESTPLLW